FTGTRTTRAVRRRLSIPESASATSSSGSAPGAWSSTPSEKAGVSRGQSPGVGQGSSTTRPPGSLNAPTIFSTIAVGQAARRSIGAGAAVHTVAGVGVVTVPRDRDRAAAEPGLAGLTLVVVEAVG